MEIKQRNIFGINRWVLIFLINSVFSLVGINHSAYSQNSQNEVSVSFLKDQDSIRSSQLYFNIFKVKNNSYKVLTGSVSFSGPEGWNIIAFSSDNVILQPGDSVLFPIRVSPLNNAVGGTAYLINATFKTTKTYTASAYLTIPAASKWEFSVVKNSMYFTDQSPIVSFQIKLSNKGNSNELIKLHYELGKLLELKDNSQFEFDEFIQLSAFKDTLITHNIAYQKNLTENDRERFERNWKESSLKAVASTDLESKSALVTFHKLNSFYINQRQQIYSPLNLDYQLNNLMSNQELTSNVRLYGSLLLPENREFQYYAGVNSFNHDFNSEFDINQQLMYSLRYIDLKNSIELGYNIFGGNLHTINGRGLAGSYKLSTKSLLSYTFTQNPFSHNIGGHVGFRSSIGGIRFNTNVIREQSENNDYIATSLSSGIGFRLFKYHSFNLQFAGSQANYKQAIRDTSLFGYSYRLNYSLRLKNFEFIASGLNTLNNYIKNAGLEQYYVDSKLSLTKNTKLILYGNRQHYSTTRYPYNFDHTLNFNSNDYLRLVTSISRGNVNFQIGPDYNGSMRQIYNSITDYKSVYITQQPGVWGAVSVKLSNNRSITPNITVSNLILSYKSDDPLLTDYSLSNNLTYSVGVNYFDPHWRMNAYYTSGSTSDIYRSIQIGDKPAVSNSIQFRPSYENSFFNKKVKLSCSINYAYYMPSGRENVSYNIRYDHLLGKGWEISANGFMYTNSRTDSEMGRISTRDMNFIVGFRKSFNFQQPRKKYYNFKTVFFNDLDGDRIMAENEPPVSNIIVNVVKNRDKPNSSTSSAIPELELMSNVHGEIYIENMPQDNYTLKFNPLVNLKSLYFIDGEVQSYSNDKTQTLYVPLVESYKVKGKINVNRDPNSSEGNLDLSGIRVVATGQKGETYSVLTDNFGSYILNVPNADKYTIRVNNILGEHYQIEADEIQVQFTQSKTINLDFEFVEKRRSIQFDNGSELFNFKSLSDGSKGLSDKAKSSQDPKSVTAEKAVTNTNSVNSKTKPSEKVNVNSKSPDRSTVVSGQKDNVQILNTNESKALSNSITQPKLLVTESVTQAKTNTLDLSDNEIYRIQIDALTEFKNPEDYQKEFNIKSKVEVAKVDGMYKYYYSDKFSTIDDARDAMVKLNIKGFPVKVSESILMNEAELRSYVGLNEAETYRIQLDALTEFKNPEDYQKEFNIKSKVEVAKVDGMYKYFYPEKFSSIDDARDTMVKLKIKGFPVEMSDSTLMSEPEIRSAASVAKDINVPVEPNALVTQDPIAKPVLKEMPSLINVAKTDKSLPFQKKIGLNDNETYRTQLDALTESDNPEDYQNVSNNKSSAEVALSGTNLKDETEIKSNVSVTKDYSTPVELKTTVKDEPFTKPVLKDVSSDKNIAISAKSSALPKAIVEQIFVSDFKEMQGDHIYSIQLESSRDYTNPDLLKSKYNLKSEVVCVEIEGLYRYYTGRYTSKADAIADIAKYGLSGRVLEVDLQKIKPLQNQN